MAFSGTRDYVILQCDERFLAAQRVSANGRRKSFNAGRGNVKRYALRCRQTLYASKG